MQIGNACNCLKIKSLKRLSYQKWPITGVLFKALNYIGDISSFVETILMGEL